MTMELRLEARRRKHERELLRKKEAEFAQDLRALASRGDGRRFLRWLLEQGAIFSPDYLPGTAGAYQAGKKATALRLWHLMQDVLAQSVFAGIALGGLDAPAGDHGENDGWDGDAI